MKRAVTTALALLALVNGAVLPAPAYVLNQTISSSGGCPQPNHFETTNPLKRIDRRWSTSPSASIKTTTGSWTGSQQVAEIQQVILDSFSVWAGVAGTTLTPASFSSSTSTQTSVQNACNLSDARNTICFNQNDSSFMGGVLAFTRTVIAQQPGETLGSKTAAFAGEILDADIYFRPNDGSVTFATPAALAANPNSFDLQSVLVHELGHFFGISHSSVWRAILWPFAPAQGTFSGERPSVSVPDAPLSDDDRTALRVLYPDPNDTVHLGRISGRVLPANPLALADQPNVTGIFGTHVVALDADTGAVVAATLGGWSCDSQNLPTRFDGTYVLDRLPLGRNYKMYAEPLDGPTGAGDIQNALDGLCRPGTNNSCAVPNLNANFTTKVRP